MENWMIEVGRWKTMYRRVPVCCVCWLRCRCRDAPTPVELSSGGMTAAARPSHCSLQRPWNNLHSAHWAYLLHTQHLHYIAQWACSGGKYVSIRILLTHKICFLTLFTVVVVHRSWLPHTAEQSKRQPRFWRVGSSAVATVELGAAAATPFLHS